MNQCIHSIDMLRWMLDGRNALEMILGIYKSMKSGKTVCLPLSGFGRIDMKGTFGK